MRCLAVLVSAFALVACGDDGVSDAGPEDAAPDAGDTGFTLPPPPPSPMPPALPTLTPCVDGFTETTVGETVELTLCTPAEVESCPPGEHLFNEGCRHVGTACPDGDFADPSGVTSPIYVDPTAAAGGDGSLAAPFATIADALATAGEGDTLMLSAGEHEASLTLDRAVTLRGACTTATSLVPAAGADFGAILTTNADGVVLQDLRITGVGFGVRAGAETALFGVVIDTAQNVGAVSEGAGVLNANDLAIVDTQPTDGSFGLGIIAMGTGRVSAERVSLARNATFSAGAYAGGVVEMRDARISDSLQPSPDGLGVAMSAAAGSTITCEGCMIERAAGLAVDVGDAGSTVTIIDGRIDETLPAGEEASGISVLARVGGHVTLTRTAVTRSVLGAVVLSSGGSGMLRDIIIHDSRRDAGLVAYARTDTTAERIALDATSGVAIHVSDPSARATFRDLTIVDSRPREMDGLGGRGIEVILGATVVLERAHLENNVEASLLLDLESTVTANDLLIRDTQPRVGIGRGINVQGMSSFDADRIEITGSSEVGVFGYQMGTSISMRGVSIAGTRARDCPDGSCLAGSGMGIVVMDEASLRTSNFLLAENELAGLQLADADVSWTDGVVRDHPIGVNIQFSDIDPSTLTENVVYLDNGQNLDATELPLPAPTPSASR